MACTSCFCWKDIRRAVVAIGVFSMVTSIVQILVTVAVFTGFTSLTATYGPVSFTPPQSLTAVAYELYIALSVFDFIIVVFALVLLCGNERTNESKVRSYFMPWLVAIPLYVLFESGTNIYYFTNQFNGRFTSPLRLGNYGFAIVPLVYWVIKDILLIAGWVVIYKRVQPFLPCCHCPAYYKTRPSMSLMTPGYAPYAAPFQQTSVAVLPAPAVVESAYWTGPAVTRPSCGCGGGARGNGAGLVMSSGGGCSKCAGNQNQVITANPVVAAGLQQQKLPQMPFYSYAGGQGGSAYPLPAVARGATSTGPGWTSSLFQNFAGRSFWS